MLRKWCYIFLFFLFLAAKFPELTPNDVKKKFEEILNVHAVYQKFTDEIAKRTLKSFINELDPGKCYFLQDDISQWLEPSNDLLNKIITDFNNAKFTTFENIYNKMIAAIKRRNALEDAIDKLPLLQKIDAKELNDLAWAETTEALKDRLLKIRSLQVEMAEKFDKEHTKNLLEKIKQKRLLKEKQFTDTQNDNRTFAMLTYTLKSLASSLDDHTCYFTPMEADDFVIQVQQKLCGIGALLNDNLNGLTIVRIVENSPASKSILKVKDRIIAVNNEPIIGMDSKEAVNLIRGEKGTEVTITILREVENEKEEKLNITMIRDEVVLEDARIESSIEPYGDGVIAVIKLHSFYQDKNNSSAGDVKKALEDISRTNKIKGVILDLRSNAGGLLTQAIDISSLFITKGVVVSIKDHKGNIQTKRNINDKVLWDGALIVLTNRASASASEIVTQCLQDYGRAIIVGDDRTFGKGTFQSFTLDASRDLKVNPKGEYKVTRGRYYTVSGKTPQLTGVKSDIVVPGLLLGMDCGEQFDKYPLQNDSIPSRFTDDLSDVPILYRQKLADIYKNNLQAVLTTHTQYLQELTKNSQKRLEENKNYQLFLKAVKEKQFDAKIVESFTENDLQLIETKNIIKDLVYLEELNNFD